MQRDDGRDVERAMVVHGRADGRVGVGVAALAGDDRVAGGPRPEDVPRFADPEVAIEIAEVHVLAAVGAAVAQEVALLLRDQRERQREQAHPQHDRRRREHEPGAQHPPGPVTRRHPTIIAAPIAQRQGGRTRHGRGSPAVACAAALGAGSGACLRR